LAKRPKAEKAKHTGGLKVQRRQGSHVGLLLAGGEGVILTPSLLIRGRLKWNVTFPLGGGIERF